MKIGPRIIASEAVTDPSQITDAWKIAAVAHAKGWHWLCGHEVGQEIHKLLFAQDGNPPKLSGVQGLQRWDGADRWVLYVRRPPGKAA